MLLSRRSHKKRALRPETRLFRQPSFPALYLRAEPCSVPSSNAHLRFGVGALPYLIAVSLPAATAVESATHMTTPEAMGSARTCMPGEPTRMPHISRSRDIVAAIRSTHKPATRN